MSDLRTVAAWLRDEARAQWARAATHDWEPAKHMAMILAMWLTDRADELDGKDLDADTIQPEETCTDG